MFGETIGYFVSLLLLFVIGIGPALLLAEAHRRLAYAVGMAPAVGLTIISLLGFPLARWVAPVQVWALPVTLVLVLTSLALAWGTRQRWQIALRAAGRGRGWQVALGVVGLGWLAVASPLALKGIQYAIYRSNPSDAFLYMSLAESLRVVDWTTLQAGAALTVDNLPQVTALAEASPTALFAVRALNLPMALNKMAVLAWTAEVTRLPVTHAYFVHHLAAFGAALPLALVIGDRLGLPRLLKFLAAPALALGFWARFVLETDSGFEISAVPVLMLLVVAWMQLESEAPRPLSRGRLLLAGAGAALFALYSPLGLLLALAAVLYYGCGLLQRSISPRTVALHGITVVLLASVLLFTGQIDYLARSALNLASRAAGEARFAAPAQDLLVTDGLAAAWGMPGSILWPARPQAFRWPLDAAATGLGFVFMAMVGFTGLQALRPNSPPPARLVSSLLGAGLLLVAAMVVANNDRAAGKSFTYVAPDLVFALLLFVCRADVVLTTAGQRLAHGVLAGWLVAQALIGVYLPLRRSPDFISQTPKAEHYDLTPITRALEQAQPRLLLVDIPRTETWMFAYYSMLTFGRYPAHFQSGLVIDNNPRYQSLWFSSLPTLPDYAVVLKQTNYIGPQQLGALVAETADLALYRLTAVDTTSFDAQEQLYRQNEKQKPLFPSLEN